MPRTPGLELAREGEAIAIGQADVEHDQVEAGLRQRRLQLRHRAHRRHVEAMARQPRQQHALAQHVVVLEQRQAQRGGHRTGGRWHGRTHVDGADSMQGR
ncbi:hypothetical protein [Pseudoxanthomonas sp. SORGH_AS_0997]|uniref:hypothetical protein n=1 Tax=Pseudoxanthomonas sp. SORGH_AS_0997 TaxID=3041776 RepID=UPI0028669A7C|nr:hypothetical protein [Pseudoxanthomonas sp. SORGH_AS_0997]MDR6139537.1 hypothetical protein [Pseudoxanthomonas sp. SORGH_AS_0997]